MEGIFFAAEFVEQRREAARRFRRAFVEWRRRCRDDTVVGRDFSVELQRTLRFRLILDQGGRIVQGASPFFKHKVDDVFADMKNITVSQRMPGLCGKQNAVQPRSGGAVDQQRLTDFVYDDGLLMRNPAQTDRRRRIAADGDDGAFKIDIELRGSRRVIAVPPDDELPLHSSLQGAPFTNRHD